MKTVNLEMFKNDPISSRLATGPRPMDNYYKAVYFGLASISLF